MKEHIIKILYQYIFIFLQINWIVLKKYKYVLVQCLNFFYVRWQIWPTWGSCWLRCWYVWQEDGIFAGWNPRFFFPLSQRSACLKFKQNQVSEIIYRLRFFHWTFVNTWVVDVSVLKMCYQVIDNPSKLYRKCRINRLLSSMRKDMN